MRGLPLQPIERIGILIFVVNQSSKRVNRLQRYLLIVGIIAVGVLDLAFTSYLNGIDAEPVSNTVARTNVSATTPPAAIDPFEQQAGQDDLTANAGTGDSPSSTSDSSHRYLKASFSALENKRADHKHSISSRGQVASAAASLDCRIVTFPFIGTGVYVQVTDNTGCRIGDSSRNKRSPLFAKATPSFTKRWQGLNTLVARLK